MKFKDYIDRTHAFTVSQLAESCGMSDSSAATTLRRAVAAWQIERAFVCLTDKLEELKDKPATERHNEMTHWLATFDCADDDTMHDARTAGRLDNNNSKLPPKA